MAADQGQTIESLKNAHRRIEEAIHIMDLVDQKPSEEVSRLLNDIYSLVFVEACGGSDTNETEVFARKLYPLMKELNKIVKFKS